jgi:hypothetical protein
MKKILAVLAVALAVALPIFALAGATWTTDTTLKSGSLRTRKATTVTGTETKPTSATAGLDLIGLAAVDGYVEFASTYAPSAGAQFVAHVKNPITGTWTTDSTLDYVLNATTVAQAFNMTVSVDAGNIAFEPTGVPSATTVYLIGRKR